MKYSFEQLARIKASLRLSVADALKPQALEHSLWQCIERRLDDYRCSPREDWNKPRREAIDRMRSAAKTLLREFARADALFTLPKPSGSAINRSSPPSAGGRRQRLRFLPHHWQSIEPDIRELAEELDGWLELPHNRPATRARGRKALDTRLRALRLSVLGDLSDAGVVVSGNRRGPAAGVLRAVLSAADEVDGKAPRLRDEFSSSDWARWLKEHKDLERLVAERSRYRGEQKPIAI